MIWNLHYFKGSNRSCFLWLLIFQNILRVFSVEGDDGMINDPETIGTQFKINCYYNILDAATSAILRNLKIK